MTERQHVPQAEARDRLYNLCVRAVIEQQGMFYDELVDILAYNVTEEHALAVVQRRRRRAINETDRSAITTGKRHVARTFIDRAHRNGRITYLQRGTQQRTIWLGSPPKGGGPAGRARTWDDERAATEAVAGILHRTRAELG